MNTSYEIGEPLLKICGRDRRYKYEAYLFVLGALHSLIKDQHVPRHVKAKELLGAITLEARNSFGPMAATVFEDWGIKNALDFGRIVFNMVREGILIKTDEDELCDFNSRDFMRRLFDPLLGYQIFDEDLLIKSGNQAVVNDSY